MSYLRHTLQLALSEWVMQPDTLKKDCLGKLAPGEFWVAAAAGNLFSHSLRAFWLIIW